MRFTCLVFTFLVESPVTWAVGLGSKTFRLLVMPRMGSTGSHRASGREKTSVQKTGGEVVGSGDAVLRISIES